MTITEITDFVTNLEPKEINNRIAEDIMDWVSDCLLGAYDRQPIWRNRVTNVFIMPKDGWSPTTDRNNSQMVIHRVGELELLPMFLHAIQNIIPGFYDMSGSDQMQALINATPLQESMAALVAFYMKKGDIK
jgi:hypothetical protein